MRQYLRIGSPWLACAWACAWAWNLSLTEGTATTTNGPCPSNYGPHAPFDGMGHNIGSIESCGYLSDDRTVALGETCSYRIAPHGTEWMSSNCPVGASCQSNEYNEWTCGVTKPLSDDDAALLCKCCAQGCVARSTYACQPAASADECVGMGPDYYYCSSGAADDAVCQTNKDTDQPNWYHGPLDASFTKDQNFVFSWPDTYFAPYVDTSAPFVNLSEVHVTHGVKYFTLGFINAKSQNGVNVCAPAFGGTVDVRTGPVTADYLEYMYADLAQVRRQGGQIGISFGGGNGVELANVCVDSDGNTSALYDAYYLARKVADAYAIDFVLQGADLDASQQQVWNYRFEAVDKLLGCYSMSLSASYTLPANTAGLLPEAQEFLAQMVLHKWNLVNVMTVNDDCPSGQSRQSCETMALNNAAMQIQTAMNNAPGANGTVTINDAFKRMGYTVMIGLNEDGTDVIWPSDLERGVELFYKGQQHPKWLSYWSLNRDHSCSDTTVRQDCSSAAVAHEGQSAVPVQTQDYEFAEKYSSWSY